MDAQTAARRRHWLLWVPGLALFLFGTLLVVQGARVDTPTVALVIVAAVLAFAIRTMYRMAVSLARPAAAIALDHEGGATAMQHRELREERRRLLRAINELKFDYDMGKLSSDDYEAVRKGFELRAVDVMRALEAEPTMAPGLAKALEERGLGPDGVRVAVEEAEDEDEEDVEQVVDEGEEVAEDEQVVDEATCPSCNRENDADAKFCKHCGKAIS